ncbi:SwmB domain-containing protein, partial [Verminephrobacter aporrectodeae]|uniref:SwmB domain-containing protein n=1 Tax=Verminephrobacter aporrectodeae TaxID=1110389 RepID=UPI002237339C
AIQDAAGNDAPSFAATAVTNNTPAPADTAAPQLIITGDSRPKVTGDQLVLSFSDTGNLDADASHKPASGAFTVLVNGVANAVTSVTFDSQAKTVTLTLTTAVTSDQTVTVAYADPTTGNDANAIQDTAGNDTASFAATAVTNNTPAPADTTAPALITTGDSRPKVTGDQLVLSFSDTGNLDADASHKPASGAFTVLVNGVANAVTNVTVEPQAKTVTLTLTTAVTSDQTVTVAYADPTTGNDANAIQDAAGNDATSFAATAVTNNTPAAADATAPALIITGDSRPKVTGDQLVLSFSDTGNLDADASHKPASGAFTVLVNGIANAVTNVTVDSQAKTVTLTLSTAVTSDQTVTVAYADPTTGNDANAIQDAAGNDATSFAATAVTNNTPAPADTTAPALIITGDTTRPKVNGNQLVLSFSDTGNLDADPTHTPANGAFTVLVNGVANAVTSVTVDSQAKTVTLTLSTAVTSGQSVTVAYADPTTGNDANAIQDAAGNDAASFAATAVTNNTPAPADTTAPALIITGDSRPKVNGNQLVLSFSDTGNLDADPTHKPVSGAFTVMVNGVANAVTSVTVDSQAKTVTLTLTTAVTSGQSVTVAYADPTTGNDANAIQDAAGNDATSFAATAVTNNTPAPADTTAPALIITGDSRPKVTGDQLVLSFSDTGNLDADLAHKPANGAFTVLVNGVANAVTNVTVDSQAKTVTLTLTTAVTSDQTVTVAYADPTTGNDANAIQDAAGNDATSFAATAVTNNTPAPADTTAPQLIITGDTRPKVTGDQLVLSFSDTGNLDADLAHKPASGAFTVMVNGVANAVTNVTVEPQAKTVTLTLTTVVTSDQSVTVAYADPTTGNDANAIQDAAGNDAASFAATAVTNNTPAPADTAAPALIITGDSRPKVTGNQLVLSFSDTGNLDADPTHTPANGAFTVLVN